MLLLLLACNSDDASNGVDMPDENNPPDNIAPVITLIGENPQFLPQNGSYAELGATATDNVDGNLNNAIEININVNTNLIGTYQVTYSVSDSSGNTTSTIRTVEVVDPNPIYLGDNGVTIKARPWAEIGEKGTLNGATYTIADRQMIVDAIQSGGDLGSLVITKVTDLGYLWTPSVSGIPRDYHMKIKNWDTSNLTSLAGFFQSVNVTYLFTVDDLDYWDVSNVTNMAYLFNWAQVNPDISTWDVSKVKNMKAMFRNSSFNSDISNWDVSNVTNMSEMFHYSGFNSPIGSWDVSNVNNMKDMFSFSNFNQPIGDWNVSSVIDMEKMFAISTFDQPIGNWNVSNVTNMREMFRFTDFNQPIGNWDVGNVTNMHKMFDRDIKFNQDISSWNTTNVTDMYAMFRNCWDMDQDLSGWNVSNVTQFEAFCRLSEPWLNAKPNFPPNPPMSTGCD